MSKIAVLKQSMKISDTSNRNGFWRGKIEDVNDPERLGRCRVRIPVLHGASPAEVDIDAGEEVAIPTKALPWAETIALGGAGNDFGSYDPPPVGSTVLIAFVMGDEKYPVIVGGTRGVPADPQEMITVAGNLGNIPDPDKTWESRAGVIDTPEDVFEGVEDPEDETTPRDDHPTRRVWHKSYKGHTIIVEEKDGKEFLKIIDRIGQTIEMFCPVTEDANKNNDSQRGKANMADGTGIPHENLVNNRGYIKITDISGQTLLLDGRLGSERIELTSQNRTGGTKQRLRLISQSGNESIEMEDVSGNKMRMSARSDTEAIVFEDRTGSKIVFNPEDGSIRIMPSGRSEVLIVRDEFKEVRGNSEEDIAGDKTETISGNHFLNIVNDMVMNVFSMLSATIGGAVSFAVSGIDPAGGLPNPSFGITTTLGSIHMTAGQLDPLAEFMGQAILGKSRLVAGLAALPNAEVSLDALTGAIDISSLLGSIGADTLAGDINLNTPVGSISISVLGDIVIDAMNATMSLGVDGEIVIENLLGSKFTIGIDGSVSFENVAGGKVEIDPLGTVKLNNGTQGCNDLPACLFTGVPHAIATAVPGPTGVFVP